FPAVTISFNLAPEAALSDAVAAISQAEHVIGMPTSVIGSYSGDAAEFAKSLAGEPWLILAAAVTIYIVLGVLYESFIHPLTILPPPGAAGGLRPLAGAESIKAGPPRRRPHRHRAAEGNEKEERNHDDRLRPRGRAKTRPPAAGVDRPGFAAAVPPDHDDHARRLVRRHPTGVRIRRRLRAAQSPRHHHRRRTAAQPAAHALYHPGHLSRDG